MGFFPNHLLPDMPPVCLAQEECVAVIDKYCVSAYYCMHIGVQTIISPLPSTCFERPPNDFEPVCVRLFEHDLVCIDHEDKMYECEYGRIHVWNIVNGRRLYAPIEQSLGEWG
jgi:hypothetical protein